MRLEHALSVFAAAADLALAILAAAAHLALAILVRLRGSTSRLALLLVALAADLCLWNAATAAASLSGLDGWRFVDNTASSYTMAIAFHFVVVFVGEGRKHRLAVRAGHLIFGAIAATCLSAFVFDATRAFPSSSLWSVLLLSAVVPFATFACVLLLRHVRRTTDAMERIRTRLVLAALLVGALLGSTDLWRDLTVVTPLAIPRLAHVATLISTGLLAVVALRLSLFERDLEGLTAVLAVVVALGAVVAYLSAFSALAGQTALLVLAVTAVSVASAAVVRAVARDFEVHRARLREHATMGRFSAQMAHDLKNPIAAIRGAALVIENDDDEQVRKMAALIADQTRRLETIVDVYGRSARVEPNVAKLSLAPFAESVVRAFEMTSDVDLRFEGAQEILADAHLVATALENLLLNAHEAGGHATLRVVDRTLGDREGVAFVVEDDGPGMDPRVAAEATSDFFTTKAHGSGLGLSFAHRVAVAHGGTLSIESRQPGVAVTLWLPRTPTLRSR